MGHIIEASRRDNFTHKRNSLWIAPSFIAATTCNAQITAMAGHVLVLLELWEASGRMAKGQAVLLSDTYAEFYQQSGDLMMINQQTTCCYMLLSSGMHQFLFFFSNDVLRV